MEIILLFLFLGAVRAAGKDLLEVDASNFDPLVKQDDRVWVHALPFLSDPHQLREH